MSQTERYRHFGVRSELPELNPRQGREGDYFFAIFLSSSRMSDTSL